MLYIGASWFIWLSILLFLKRLTHRASKSTEILLNVNIGLSVVFLILAVLFTTLVCTPVAASWDLRTYMQSNRKCMDEVAVLLSMSIIHVVFSILLLILPIRIVWGLQLPTRAKVSLILLFFFGGLACVFSILRMLYIKKSFFSYDFTCKQLSRFRLFSNYTDSSLDNHVYPAIYGQLELTMALILSSLPALSFLLIRWRKPATDRSIATSSQKQRMARTDETSSQKQRMARTDETSLIKKSIGADSEICLYELSTVELEKHGDFP
jgi:hypothetical protein